MPRTTSYSKFYDNKPYWYWWDVWDTRKEAVARAGQLTLVQSDTGRKTIIQATALLPLLTESRRTSRNRRKSSSGKGNWGLYVRPNRPDEIQVERGGAEKPSIIPVQWQDP